MSRLFYCGRTRSGRRWFWAAEECGYINGTEPWRYGWADTEADAIAAARAAVEELAGGDRHTVGGPYAYVATRRLKDVNRARRAARPASKVKGGAFVEYLYAVATAARPTDSKSSKRLRNESTSSNGVNGSASMARLVARRSQ
jgi:hypothetical protein